MDNVGRITTVARRRRVAVFAAVLAGMASGVLASPASSQSLTDRFKNLFGGKSEQPAESAPTAASTILSQSVKGDIAEDLLAKGIAEVRQKLN